jgi:hypothetical protein
MRTHQGGLEKPLEGEAQRSRGLQGLHDISHKIFPLLLVPLGAHHHIPRRQSGGGPHRADRNSAPCRFLVMLALRPSPNSYVSCAVPVPGGGKSSLCGESTEYLKIGCPCFEQRQSEA